MIVQVSFLILATIAVHWLLEIVDKFAFYLQHGEFPPAAANKLAQETLRANINELSFKAAQQQLEDFKAFSKATENQLIAGYEKQIKVYQDKEELFAKNEQAMSNLLNQSIQHVNDLNQKNIELKTQISELEQFIETKL